MIQKMVTKGRNEEEMVIIVNPIFVLGNDHDSESDQRTDLDMSQK